MDSQSEGKRFSFLFTFTEKSAEIWFKSELFSNSMIIYRTLHILANFYISLNERHRNYFIKITFNTRKNVLFWDYFLVQNQVIHI